MQIEYVFVEADWYGWGIDLDGVEKLQRFGCQQQQ
jgi:hypothetical protein